MRFTSGVASLLLLLPLSLEAARKRPCDPLSRISFGRLSYRDAMAKRIGGTDDYPEFKSYNDAMEAALAWLRDRGYLAQNAQWQTGKISEKYGAMLPNSFEQVGPNGEPVQLRIECHAIKKLEGKVRAHINVSLGKEDGPHFLFPGGQAEVDGILRHFRSPSIAQPPQ